MNRSKSIILIVLIALIIFLLSIAIILIFRLKNSLTLLQPNNVPSQSIEPITAHSTDPAKMFIASDQSHVQWEVSGQFTSPLEQRGDFLTGTFVLKEDKNNKPLTIFLGPKGTQQLIGNNNTWTKTTLDNAAKQIPINQPIKLYFQNHALNKSTSEIQQYRSFWLDINSQINRQGGITSFTLSEPELWLYTNKIGINL